MNTDQRLDSLIGFIEQTARDASAFASEQAPLVATEIVRWEIVYCSVVLVFAASVAAGALAFLRMARKTESEDREFAAFAMFMIFALASIALGTSAGCGLAKAVTAPRLVVLDYVREIGGAK